MGQNAIAPVILKPVVIWGCLVFCSGCSGLCLGWCLNTSRDGEPTNFLGNMFQLLITLTAEMFLPLFKWNVDI